MLFGEATEENALCMKVLLDKFCQYSGHKVNASKSLVCFSTNVEVHDRDRLGGTLGFQIEEDLGVPLLYKRTIKRTFQFVVNKVQKRLSGFEGKLLSLARRITLVKSVLLAIPGYFMQSSLILIGVYEKIEQIMR